MKTCSACLQAKERDEFQKRAASVDGLTAACKKCLQARDKARYPGEKENRLASHKEYKKTPAGRAAYNRAHANWDDRNPERRKAQWKVSNALRDGRLQRDPCHCCGDLEVEAHHPDYSRPLDVVWLCIKDHKQLHEEHERQEDETRTRTQ